MEIFEQGAQELSDADREALREAVFIRLAAIENDDLDQAFERPVDDEDLPRRREQLVEAVEHLERAVVWLQAAEDGVLKPENVDTYLAWALEAEQMQLVRMLESTEDPARTEGELEACCALLRRVYGAIGQP